MSVRVFLFYSGHRAPLPGRGVGNDCFCVRPSLVDYGRLHDLFSGKGAENNEGIPIAIEMGDTTLEPLAQSATNSRNWAKVIEKFRMFLRPKKGKI